MGEHPRESTRAVTLHVHLLGSRLGPLYRSVDLTLDVPRDWTDERIRREAATHYSVPLNRVDDPVPVTWEDDRVA